jgi:MFS family permease
MALADDRRARLSQPREPGPGVAARPNGVPMTDNAAALAAPSRALVPVLMFLGLMTAVISSLGAPLLPLIARVDHVSLASAQWSLTAALVSGAACSPLMGRLGDGPRRRAVILGGLGVVLAGCALAAVATSLPILVVGRALQGTGLGLLPLMMAAARDLLPPDRARPAIAGLSVMAAAGVGLGYPISALLAQDIDLHAAFWFGAVVIGIALALGAAAIPANRSASSARLDARGAATMAAGLVVLLVALSEGDLWGWLSARTLLLLALAAVLLAAWVTHELRTADPLVDLRLVRIRGALTADVVGFVLGVALYMMLTVEVATVQVPHRAGGFGASVVVSGLTLLPFSVLSLLAARASPHVGRWLGARQVLPVGVLAVAGGSLFFALTRTALWQAFAMMGVMGIGYGLSLAALPGLIVRSVPAGETGSAMGFYQVSRYVGGSLGSALVASILSAYTRSGDTLPRSGGYEVALFGAFGVCTLCALIGWVLPERDRRGLAAAGQEAAAVVHESARV